MKTEQALNNLHTAGAGDEIKQEWLLQIFSALHLQCVQKCIESSRKVSSISFLF
jgi:hypothetical protein